MNIYKVLTICLSVYLVYALIAEYGKYRRWIEAVNTVNALHADFKAEAKLFDNAIPVIDSLYPKVKDTKVKIDSQTHATIDSLVRDLEARRDRTERISRNIDVFVGYVRMHEPFWHHVYVSLRKRHKAN